jgi:hypothetical protein
VNRQRPTISVERAAGERIRKRGGRVFLWQLPVGTQAVRDCVSLERGPAELNFDQFHDDKRGIDVYLAKDVIAREVIIRSRRWPFGGVRIYVDGKRWGWGGGDPGLVV